jgi:hypothetical protein
VKGVSVLAQGAGTVVAYGDAIGANASGNHGLGNFITIQYDGFVATYAHLEAWTIPSALKGTNAVVTAGSVIGVSGASGVTGVTAGTGYHLHVTYGVATTWYQGLLIADGSLGANPAGAPVRFLASPTDGGFVFEGESISAGDNSHPTSNVAPVIDGLHSETAGANAVNNTTDWFYAGDLNGNAVGWWSVYDGNSSSGSGYFTVTSAYKENIFGVMEQFSGAVPAGVSILVPTSAIAGLKFVGGSSGYVDNVSIAAGDGALWSAWLNVAVTSGVMSSSALVSDDASTNAPAYPHYLDPEDMFADAVFNRSHGGQQFGQLGPFGHADWLLQ